MKLIVQALIAFSASSATTAGFVVMRAEPAAEEVSPPALEESHEQDAEQDSSVTHEPDSIADEPDGTESPTSTGNYLLPATEPETEGIEAVSNDSANAELLESIRYLSRVFANMRPDDAAAVLRHLTDREVAGILRHFNSRVAAGILGSLSDRRAAAISRLLLYGCEGCEQ